MEKKITKAQMFTFIKSITDTLEIEQFGDGSITGEMVDNFLIHELELLAKKSASKKPSKKNEENEVLKAKIVEVLGTFENGATVSEILGASEDFSGMSNQKISALVRQLVLNGTVVKTTDKKKSIFSVA